MAVLESIRKKGGVIVAIVIGIALFAFIIGDFVPGGRRANNYDIVKVDGTTLSVHEYERRVEEVGNMYKQELGQTSLDESIMNLVYERAWQMMIEEIILEHEYEYIGLTVSSSELFDLIQGANPHSYIRQNFTNPQTGEFDRPALINFLKNKDQSAETQTMWNAVEKSLLKERYVQKFQGLVVNGLFVPDFLMENENESINKRVDFDYISRQYDFVPDSSVKITPADVKTYYNQHKEQWKQEVSRDIEYVIFNILPSEEDRQTADAWMQKMKPEFEQVADVAQFLTLNSDAPYDNRFLKEEQLLEPETSLFNAQIGTIIGPFEEGGALRMMKLVGSEMRPDSVKVRQIALPAPQTQQEYDQLQLLADSIKTAIEKGANFTELAFKYSADPSIAVTNGDIGWVREEVMQVGSMAVQLFNLKKNEVAVLGGTQGLFIAQVTELGKGVKKVQIATLQHDIMASTKTGQIAYAAAAKFASESRDEKSFEATATAQGINTRVASNLKENDRQIPGLTAARPIVRWAYNAKKGNVSQVFSTNDAYVIAVLKAIHKAGIPPQEQVASEINMELQKEKKAEKLMAEFSEKAKGTQSLSDLALQLRLPIESASGISFSAFSIPGVGVEPSLIAAATTASEGNISGPIKGDAGVFMITVKQIIPAGEETKEIAKNVLLSTYSNRAMSETVSSLHKAADVKDMRSKFY